MKHSGQAGKHLKWLLLLICPKSIRSFIIPRILQTPSSHYIPFTYVTNSVSAIPNLYLVNFRQETYFTLYFKLEESINAVYWIFPNLDFHFLQLKILEVNTSHLKFMLEYAVQCMLCNSPGKKKSHYFNCNFMVPIFHPQQNYSHTNTNKSLSKSNQFIPEAIKGDMILWNPDPRSPSNNMQSPTSLQS